MWFRFRGFGEKETYIQDLDPEIFWICYHCLAAINGFSITLELYMFIHIFHTCMSESEEIKF